MMQEPCCRIRVTTTGSEPAHKVFERALALHRG
jgi:hypothetical protein